ncbi:MAG TPA: GNAT family N-acetyltransferase [Verrucomicrobiales bacterium]|nr:GNAT family N-acetyltransferase [Verrucomicrobiales bacterium]
MHISVQPVSSEEIIPLRVRYRGEANGQIVYDSIHTRAGWSKSYLLRVGDSAAGFGSVAIEGPWKDKPTVFEFYVLPEWRGRAFDLFEAFLAESGARFFEVQTSDSLLTAMLHTFGCGLASESIVFRDGLTTSLTNPRTTLKRVTSHEESLSGFAERAGKSEWNAELDGRTAGTGGLMFHYNHPYCDVYMEIAKEFRGRGLGAYFVQELKRIAYEMGGIPAARCDPGNVASRKTLQKAGFVPFAHILTGKIVDTPE